MSHRQCAEGNGGYHGKWYNDQTMVLQATSYGPSTKINSRRDHFHVEVILHEGMRLVSYMTPGIVAHVCTCFS